MPEGGAGGVDDFLEVGEAHAFVGVEAEIEEEPQDIGAIVFHGGGECAVFRGQFAFGVAGAEPGEVARNYGRFGCCWRGFGLGLFRGDSPLRFFFADDGHDLVVPALGRERQGLGGLAEGINALARVGTKRH